MVDREAVLARCRGLAGASEVYPFGDEVAVFKAAGKIFALVTLDDAPGSVSLKCDPGYAIALREQYPAVTPGYHLAKRHWNTVQLDDSVPAAELEEWIEDSYELVVARLPRHQQRRFGFKPG
jgi:predicted DNA-binding protein (MmcQ/YjbR family)